MNENRKAGLEKNIRKLLFVLIDIICCFFAFALAVWFQNSANNYNFPFSAGTPLQEYFTIYQVGLFILIYLASFAVFGLYSSIWTVSGLSEGMMIVVSSAVGLAGNIAANFGLRFIPFMKRFGFEKVPEMWRMRGMHMVGLALAAVFIVAFLFISRYGVRMLRRLFSGSMSGEKNTKKKPTLIVGAGYFGAYVHSQLSGGHDHSNCYTAAFVDDDKSKVGLRIDGVKVMGTTQDIPDIVRKKNIEEIIIAIPSLSVQRQAEIVTLCRNTKCHVRIVSPLRDLKENPTMRDIRETRISDILFRPEVDLDTRSISEYIEHKTVLVTGGGGSIGSEICRQVAVFYPAKLIVFDIYENNAYELYCELKQRHPWLNVIIRIGSVRDIDRLDAVMEEFHPDIVLHTAAHKHVPLMEDSPAEAVKNNVFGTLNVLKSADRHGVKRFVQLSTDKAVNPTNVMGATKRITELIVQQYAKSSVMRCMTVRFGNVLGSHGSVIPLFERQIKNGGPVLVTDRNITRFFMTIPEAAQLVLQAGALGETGAIYVLDMGEPVKIYDLAEKVIRFHGFEPNVDMPIEITGLRPGEKMYEELLTPDEVNKMEKTSHGRIMKAHPEPIDNEVFNEKLEELRELAEVNSMGVVECIEEILPNFDHKKNEQKKTA